MYAEQDAYIDVTMLHIVFALKLPDVMYGNTRRKMCGIEAKGRAVSVTE